LFATFPFLIDFFRQSHTRSHRSQGDRLWDTLSRCTLIDPTGHSEHATGPSAYHSNRLRTARSLVPAWTCDTEARARQRAKCEVRRRMRLRSSPDRP